MRDYAKTIIPQDPLPSAPAGPIRLHADHCLADLWWKDRLEINFQWRTGSAAMSNGMECLETKIGALLSHWGQVKCQKIITLGACVLWFSTSLETTTHKGSYQDKVTSGTLFFLLSGEEQLPFIFLPSWTHRWNRKFHTCTKYSNTKSTLHLMTRPLLVIKSDQMTSG